MKKIFSIGLAAALVLGAFSCASNSGVPQTTGSAQLDMSNTPRPQILDAAGWDIGNTTIPGWVNVYSTTRSVTQVEELPEYSKQNVYCFIADRMAPVATGAKDSAVLQALLTWARRFDAQQEIGMQVKTRTASLFQGAEQKLGMSEEQTSAFINKLNLLTNATYSGARKEGDYWVKQLIKTPGRPDEIRFTVYTMYIYPKDKLNEIVAAQLKAAAAEPENKAYQNAFDALSVDVMSKGLDDNPDLTEGPKPLNAGN